MPTYTYKRQDGSVFEIEQRITAPALSACPTTGQPVTRVITGGAGLVFKGTGFYVTDYARKGNGGSAGSGSSTSSGSDSGSNQSSGSDSSSESASSSSDASGSGKSEKSSESKPGASDSKSDSASKKD
jgi:predicted nucleic acid-binding Zn ribbon protein